MFFGTGSLLRVELSQWLQRVKLSLPCAAMDEAAAGGWGAAYGQEAPVEEGASGGFGSQVLHHLANAGGLDHGLKLRCLTLPDRFVEQDKPEVMYQASGLDAAGIVSTVFKALGRDEPDIPVSTQRA